MVVRDYINGPWYDANMKNSVLCCYRFYLLRPAYRSTMERKDIFAEEIRHLRVDGVGSFVRTAYHT